MGSCLSSNRPPSPAVSTATIPARDPDFVDPAVELEIATVLLIGMAEHSFFKTIGWSGGRLDTATLEPPFFVMYALISSCYELMRMKLQPMVVSIFIRHSLVASGLVMALPEWDIDPDLIAMGEARRARYGILLD